MDSRLPLFLFCLTLWLLVVVVVYKHKISAARMRSPVPSKRDGVQALITPFARILHIQNAEVLPQAITACEDVITLVISAREVAI